MVPSVIVADFEIESIASLSSDRRVWSGTTRSVMPAFTQERHCARNCACVDPTLSKSGQSEQEGQERLPWKCPQPSGEMMLTVQYSDYAARFLVSRRPGLSYAQPTIAKSRFEVG